MQYAVSSKHKKEKGLLGFSTFTAYCILLTAYFSAALRRRMERPVYLAIDLRRRVTSTQLLRVEAHGASLLPAFAESPVRKGGDECEKGIHRSLGEGGSASAGSAEDVKMPRAAARGASHYASKT
jgi:hypothetical protein